MPPTGPAVDPSAALTERELEVLRLLAGGHTVKTIAAELGRSESSIHERLRDARRKTGVGSSRELARLIEGQKSWDRKSGLAAQAQAADRGKAPGPSGRTGSKGLAPMLIVAAFSAAGLIVAAPSVQQAMVEPTAATAPATTATLAGRWSLDVAAIPAEERPQRVTIAFAQEADGRWTSAVEIVDADAGRREGRSTAATDGVPVPISGNLGFADSVSLRQPATNMLVMSLRKNGAPVSTRVYALAKDGRSMTETISWPNAEDQKLQVARFVRVG